jgi:transcriptional regulator with XRE-family HTH domain
MRSFGNTIKSLRVAKDLSLHKTARLVGATHFYIDRIEEGAVVPTEGIAKKLAKSLARDAEEEGALLQLWRSSCEQPTAPTEPSLSPEADALLHDEERQIFET